MNKNISVILKGDNKMIDIDKIKEDLDEAFDGLIKGFNEQFEKSNKDFEKRSQEKLDRLLEEEQKNSKVTTSTLHSSKYLYSKYQITNKMEELEYGYFTSINMANNAKSYINTLDSAITELQEIIDDAEKESIRFIERINIDSMKKEVRRMKLAKYYLSNCE